MRIISGKYKGMEIPFVNNKFDNANATPQKIKKAVFSIIGEDLAGKSFLDLYACSGQMGMEALSRGALYVVFNEIDKKRFRFIRAMIREWNLEGSSLTLNFHAFRCLRYLDSKGLNFDYIFIDPPYLAGKLDADYYYRIMDELKNYNILKTGGRIIIQHPGRININAYSSNFKYAGTKKYAKNSLSIYKKGG